MRKIALLIGMGEYSSSELDNLPQAEKDADDLYRVLVDPKLGEFPAENIELLKSPSKREMELKIDWLFDDREKEDLLLFYFAGHGVTDYEGHLYLTANDTFKKVDGRLNTFSAIDSSYLLKYIEDSKSDRKVLILDACYSGAIAQGLTGRGTAGVKLKESFGGKGTAILASSGSTERTWDGIYTRCLVEGIETGAADLDRDGWISLEDLHNYVVDRVGDASSKMTMTPRFIPVKDRGHSIHLAKSPTDPKLKYERLLQKDYSEENWGKLSDVVRSLLLEKQHEWGISSAEAETIEARVLLYRSKLIEYEQGLTNAIQKQYPISTNFQAKLTEFQKYFKLRDEDISKIRRRVLPPDPPTPSNPAPAAIPTALSETVSPPPVIEPPQSIIVLSTFSFKTAQVAFEIISQKYLLILRLGVCALFITSIPYLLLNTSLFGKKHPSDEKIYTITMGLDSDWRISIEENSNGVSNRAVTSWTQKTGKNSQFKLIRDRSNESYEIRPRVADNWGACLSISTDSILSQNKCNGTLNQKFIIDCEKKDTYNNFTACSIINRNSNNVIGVEWDNPDKKNPIRESSAYDPANARWWSFVVSE
jgi:Caspase domain